MIDPCCETVIGGEILIVAHFRGGAGAGNTGGGTATYEALGAVRLQPSGVSRASGASSGGTPWVTEAPRPVRALMVFANRCKGMGGNPIRMFKERCSLHIVIQEISRGISHLLTNATIVGDPEYDFNTGALSGMEIICDRRDYTVDDQAVVIQTSGQMLPLGGGN